MRKKLILFLLCIVLCFSLNNILSFIRKSHSVSFALLQNTYSSNSIRNSLSLYIITQYGDKDGNQSMFYTIQNEKKQLLVIDGGYRDDEQTVRDVIKADGNVSPDWLMENKNPKTGKIGKWSTPQNAALMQTLGAAIFSFHTAPNRIYLY